MGSMAGLGVYYQQSVDSCAFGIFADNRLSERISKYDSTKLSDLSFSNTSDFYLHRRAREKICADGCG